jgi:hypothetical protein
MIEHGTVDESQVVLAFLKAEVDSPRYRDHVQSLLKLVGINRGKLIDEPDMKNDCCNALRRILLSYRGFPQRESLFLGFPIVVNWRLVELEPHDLSRLKYIRNPDWLAHSDQTRRPQRVLERMAKGEIGDDPAKHVLAIQERLKRGERLPELVAVEGQGKDLILIEGHCRATAYIGMNWSENIPIFLASSISMAQWAFY